MWSIVFRRFEALAKKCQRTADLLLTGHRTVGSVLPRLAWAVPVVEEAVWGSPPIRGEEDRLTGPARGLPFQP